MAARLSAFAEEHIARERLERAATLPHRSRSHERTDDGRRITTRINALDKRRQ
jgi:hypothetical protein